MGKIKWIWYAVLAAIFLLGYFGLFSLPKDWSATMLLLAAIEKWWGAHAAYPAIAAFAVGLAVSTVFIPELWTHLKPIFFPQKLRPDVDGATAFKEVLAKSKRAKLLVGNGTLTMKRMYESHLTEAGIIEGRLKAKIADEFHDLMRAGDITVWGSPDNKKPHQEIKPEEWSEIEIDFDEQDMNYNPPHVHAVKRNNRSSGSVFGYVWLKMCRRQVRKAFPHAFLPRRMPSDLLKDKAHERAR
jgi:hypothetical protein